MRRRFILVTAAALAAACATPVGPDAAARFDSYEGEAALKAYSAVYIAPVTASEEIVRRVGYRPFGTQDRVRPLSESEIDSQQEKLARVLAERLGRSRRLAEGPGDGVLTIATELTALESNLPTFSELSANPSLDPRSVSIGDAAVRVVLSENGRSFAVIEDATIRPNFNDPAVGVGRWITANRYYDRLADKLDALLAG